MRFNFHWQFSFQNDENCSESSTDICEKYIFGEFVFVFHAPYSLLFFMHHMHIWHTMFLSVAISCTSSSFIRTSLCRLSPVKMSVGFWQGNIPSGRCSSGGVGGVGGVLCSYTSDFVCVFKCGCEHAHTSTGLLYCSFLYTQKGKMLSPLFQPD